MTGSDFGIEKVVRTSFYRIHQVPIGTDGRVYTVELQTDLLGNGAYMTQDQWAEVSKAGLDIGGYGYLSLPQIRSVVHILRVNDDNSQYKSFVREVQDFLKGKHIERWLITSTRVNYIPDKDEDFVIHEFGLNGEHKIKANILGSDEWLNKTRTPQGYQALFDTDDDIKEINDDFKYIYGTDTFVFKYNSNLIGIGMRAVNFNSAIDTRAVSLNAGPDKFYIYCDRNLQNLNSAIGGRIFAEGETAPKN